MSSSPLTRRGDPASESFLRRLVLRLVGINTLFYRKIEDLVPTFKQHVQLSSLQTIGELMTSSNHYINIQLAKLISSCFDLRNILLDRYTTMFAIIITVLDFVYKSF